MSNNKEVERKQGKNTEKFNVGCHLPLLGRPSRRWCVRIHYSHQLPSVNGIESAAMFYLKE